MTFRIGTPRLMVRVDRRNLDALHTYRNDAPTPDSDDQSIAVPTAITA
jgi:hypothetical protein